MRATGAFLSKLAGSMRCHCTSQPHRQVLQLPRAKWRWIERGGLCIHSQCQCNEQHSHCL